MAALRKVARGDDVAEGKGLIVVVDELKIALFPCAGGAQAAGEGGAAVREALARRSGPRGGPSARSRSVDGTIGGARGGLGAVRKAGSRGEIAFGATSTAVMRSVAEALRPTLKGG